jgi:hypothetical protein
MYFSIARIAVTLAALPFLVGAVPVQKSKRNTLSVPLSKRFTHRDADGVVSVPNLLAGVHHTTVFVLLIFFAEKGGSLTKVST